MDKIINDLLVEPMDEIILLNDNYSSQGLKRGYIGVVIDNLIEENGYILVDFFNPFTGEDIAVLAKIKKGDYRICDAKRDREAGKAYRDLFRK